MNRVCKVFKACLSGRQVHKVVKVIFTLGTFCFMNFQLYAQQHIIDSLRNVLRTEQEDTNKVKTFNEICRNLINTGDYHMADSIANRALELAVALTFTRGRADAINNMGVIDFRRGDFAHAVKHDSVALVLYTQLKNKKGTGNAYSNLGLANWRLGNNAQALEYYFEGLKIRKEIDDKKGIANSSNNIGLVYYLQGDYPTALTYNLEALKTRQALGDSQGIALSYNNIGLVYEHQRDFPNALKNTNSSLEIRRKLGDESGVADAYGYLGIIYTDLENYTEALKALTLSLQIEKEIGDKSGAIITIISIGNVYYLQGHYTNALTNHLEAFTMEKEINDEQDLASSYNEIGSDYIKLQEYPKAKEALKNALRLGLANKNKTNLQFTYNALTSLDSAVGDYKKTFADFKQYMAYRDSLLNEANTKKTVQAQMNYEFDQKQAAEKAEQDKKDAVADADKRKQRIITWSVAGGLVLVLVFAAFIFRSLRITRKQKQLIEIKNKETEEQKKVIEEKNKDITDSIHYASRIQRALLTTEDYIGNRLKEYFILFKPRDIVSGDFYWANEVETNEGKRFMICAGDCTGHGVPGAFMSLLNISMLNEANIEKKIHEPAKVLDEVREHIIKALNPEGKDEGSKDGMDCILCSFSLTDMMLDFACANNPLWIVRGTELIEFKPDKMPVGQQGEKQMPFTLQRTPVQKGDMVYIFTDGYADQFGGPKGKKFKYKTLSEKLKVISEKPMTEQKNILEQTFEEWKGNLEQVDDVLIIGIRI